jgi:hypothetical protein
MNFINLTPHDIVLNNGTIYPPSGEVARVGSEFIDAEHGFVSIKYTDIQGLPKPQPNTFYIVSSMVKSTTDRKDVIAPATSHPEVVRNDKGHIISVPTFQI